MTPIRTWSQDVTVGIYDGEQVVTLYADHAVISLPTVRWVGNTGGYHETKIRLNEQQSAPYREILAHEAEDDEDYTDAALALACTAS